MINLDDFEDVEPPRTGGIDLRDFEDVEPQARTGGINLDDFEDIPAEPSFGALVTGAGKVIGAVSSPLQTVGQALGAAIGGKPWMSSGEVASLKEYGPAVAAGGIGLAMSPASVPAAVASSVLLGRGADAARAALTGKPVWEEVTKPYREPGLTAALEAGVPLLGGAAMKLLAMRNARASQFLSPADEATEILYGGKQATTESMGLARPLPDLTPAEAADALPRALATAGEKPSSARTVLVPPVSAAERSAEPAARAAGEAIRRTGMYERRIGETLRSQVEPTLGRLPVEQQIAVREAVRSGTVDALPDDLRPVGQLMRQVTHDTKELQADAGVMEWFEGEQVPAGVKENYWPAYRQLPGGFRDKKSAGGIQKFLGKVEEKRLEISPEVQAKAEERAANAWAKSRASQPMGGKFMQHESKPDVDLPELTPIEQMRIHIDDVARQASAARTMGGKMTHGYGERIAGLVSKVEDPTQRARLGETVDAIYKRKYGPLDDWLANIRKMTGRMSLTAAWSHQLQQLANPISTYGLRNVIKGRRAYKYDPVIGELAEASGAGEAGLSGMIEREMGIDKSNLPFQLLSSMEHGMREGFAAPAAYMRLQEIAEAVSSGKTNAALDRSARELGTSLTEIRDAILLGGGKIDPSKSRSLVLDVMQGGSDRTLLQTSHGSMPSALENPAMQTALLYRKFGVGQTDLVAKDYVAPLVEGLKQRDMSLVKLGLGRLGRHAAYGTALNVPTHLAHSLLSGRLPTAGRFASDLLGGNYGTAGDLASGAIDTWASPGRESLPERMTAMPSASTTGQVLTGATRGLKNATQGDFDAAALDLAAAVLHGAQAFDERGRYSMAARPIAGMLREMRKDVDERAR